MLRDHRLQLLPDLSASQRGIEGAAYPNRQGLTGDIGGGLDVSLQRYRNVHVERYLGFGGLQRIIERFVRRLRAMPVWERPTIWVLIRDYKDRLDQILSKIDAGALEKFQNGIKAFLAGDDDGLTPLMQFTHLCTLSWKQFSAIGQTFEDLVREWFLQTFVGQLGNGEEETCRELPKPLSYDQLG